MKSNDTYIAEFQKGDNESIATCCVVAPSDEDELLIYDWQTIKKNIKVALEKKDAECEMKGARKYRDIIRRGMNGWEYTSEDRKFLSLVNQK